MGGSTLQVRRDFDRLAAFDRDEWDHNGHYHNFLLQALPSERRLALEVGCGTGAFARALGQEFDRVLALDISSAMVERARVRSAAFGNVEFREADFLTFDLSAATYDCIASIATLHHLPLEDSLQRLAAAIRPGGTLLVLDLYAPRSLWDWICVSSAVPLNLLMRAWKLRRLTEPALARQAWAEHARSDVYAIIPEVRSIAERLLPGARVRRHLFWRYSLIWRKPAAG